MVKTTGSIVSIIIGGVIGFGLTRLFGFSGVIAVWIFIFLGACAGGYLYQLVSPTAEKPPGDDKSQ
jgi:hypothetical protein